MSRQPSPRPSVSTKRVRRTFSTEFKRTKVRQIESGLLSVGEIAREHEVSTTAVYNWIDKFGTREKSTRVVVELQSEERRTRLLRQELAELERVVGRKQIELDFLQALVDVSSRELGIDLKKTFGVQPSNGSDRTTNTEDGQ